MQDRLLVRLCHLLIFQHFGNLMFAEFIVHFVRIVTRKNERLISYPLDRIGDIGLFAFAADKNPAFVDVSRDIFTDFFFGA